MGQEQNLRTSSAIKSDASLPPTEPLTPMQLEIAISFPQ